MYIPLFKILFHKITKMDPLILRTDNLIQGLGQFGVLFSREMMQIYKEKQEIDAKEIVAVLEPFKAFVARTEALEKRVEELDQIIKKMQQAAR